MRRQIRSPWPTNAMLTFLGVLLLLWAFSVPGFAFLASGAAVLVLGVAGAWWFGLLFQAVGSRSWSWWVAVAPAAVLVALVLLAVDTPFSARWAVSRPAFDEQVKDLPSTPTTADDWVELDVPPRLGLYRVTHAWRVRGGVIFYEANGNLADDAGFAYLPEGPDASLESGSFERPQFRHLSGH